MMATSAKNTEIFKSNKIQEISSKIPIEMNLIMRGFQLENINGKNCIVETVEVDPINQVGLTLAKGFLVKSFKNYHDIL